MATLAPQYLLAIVAVLTLIWRVSGRSRLSLPPGPKGFPIIGNLLDMPKDNMVVSMHQLCRQYGECFSLWRCLAEELMTLYIGDIVYLDVFGQPTIIIDSYDSAIAILESRSANTSDRPRFIMAEL